MVAACVGHGRLAVADEAASHSVAVAVAGYSSAGCIPVQSVARHSVFSRCARVDAAQLLLAACLAFGWDHY